MCRLEAHQSTLAASTAKALPPCKARAHMTPKRRLAPFHPDCWHVAAGLHVRGLVCRLEVHQSTLAAAKAKLLALMRDTPPDELEQLLHSTFAYIGLVPLRDVFLAIVGRQVPMDGHQLDGIAADPELFSELPIGVQRQVLRDSSSCGSVQSPSSEQAHAWVL